MSPQSRCGKSGVACSERTLWVRVSIIIASYRLMHMVVMSVDMVRCAIGADRAMVVVPVAVIPIDKRINAIVWTPVVWVIAPVVWRMPAYPARSPEPIIDNRTVDVYWFDDIIGTIDILITNDLNGNSLALLLLLEEDRSYILIDILGKYSLNNN